MIQTNLLMDSLGKTPDSFVVLDLMRLPLGILTGVGFIGGGAFLKRGDAILGLTTAATLWFVTVVGLCIGGGQLGLGVGGTMLGFVILRGLKLPERRLKRERPAELMVKWRHEAFGVEEVLATIGAAGLPLSNLVVKRNPVERIDELRCSVRRHSLPDDHRVPAEISNLTQRQGVLEWEWKDDWASAPARPRACWVEEMPGARL
jgi:putative Mg2+ transporter-C (MgtC) family protein